MARSGQARRLSSGGELILRILFTLCLAGTIVFIFSNSSQVGEASSARSGSVVDTVNGILGRIGVGYRFSELLIRKLGHVAEYMLLGMWLLLTLRIYTRRVISFLGWPLFLGLGVAVADELYQTFVPGRDGQVMDVAIDFCGIAGGIFAGLIVVLLAGAVWDAFHGRR